FSASIGLNSTATLVKASGWQSGIKSDVRFAAWIAAMRATPSTSPFLASPASICCNVAGCMRIRPEARATRCVSFFPATSTISACPAESKWVSLFAVIFQELAAKWFYHSIMRWSRLLTILLLIVPTVLAEGLPDLGDSSQSSFSAIEERRLGEEIMREVRADRTYYD